MGPLLRRSPAAPCAGALLVATVLALASGAPAREFLDAPVVQEFTPEEVMQILIFGGDDGPVVIDARPRNKYLEGHVPGAMHLDPKETWGRLEELRRYEDRGLIFYDLKGLSSRVPTRALLREGFRRIGVMKGHLVEWRRRGYPIEVGPGE